MGATDDTESSRERRTLPTRGALPAGDYAVELDGHIVTAVVFAETRPLAQEWTFRFLGAALAHHHDHDIETMIERSS